MCVGGKKHSKKKGETVRRVGTKEEEGRKRERRRGEREKEGVKKQKTPLKTDSK